MSVLRYTPTDDGTQDLDLEPTQRDDETVLASDDEPGANEVRVSPEPPRNQASTSNNLMQPNLEQPIEGRPRSFSELFSWYGKLKSFNNELVQQSSFLQEGLAVPLIQEEQRAGLSFAVSGENSAQPPRVLTLNHFKMLSEGDRFTIPIPNGSIQGVIIEHAPMSIDLEGPPDLYEREYKGSWLFPSGEGVPPQGIISDSCVVVCRPPWLLDGTVQEIKQYGKVSIWLIVSSTAEDGRGVIRPAFKRTSQGQLNLAMARLLTEATKGISINLVLMEFTPKDLACEEAASRYCSKKGIKTLWNGQSTYLLL